MQIYLVGGAVRDTLLGYPVYDRDWVVVGATPEQMLDKGFKPVGKDFPVFIHPESGEEYALARTERKSGKGYTGFQYHASPDVTLEQDLIRRDLTINAMAMAEDQSIIDPYGGQQDLSDKLLRHVSPAFAEDPLRVLRVARFLARYSHFGFQIADDTLLLMHQLSSDDELEHLTTERVWQEFQRALAERSADQFFTALLECGALSKLFPELISAVEHQPTMSRLNDTQDPEVRFALLLSQALSTIPAQQRADLISELCQQHRVPNNYRDLALQLSLHGHALLVFNTLTAEQRLQVVKDLDLLRRPEKLPKLLQAVTVQNAEESEAVALLPQLLCLLEKINPQQLMQQGYKGKALGDAISRAQLGICQQQVEGKLS